MSWEYSQRRMNDISVPLDRTLAIGGIGEDIAGAVRLLGQEVRKTHNKIELSAGGTFADGKEFDF